MVLSNIARVLHSGHHDSGFQLMLSAWEAVGPATKQDSLMPSTNKPTNKPER